MKIDEVPSLARKSRVAAHTHIKVRANARAGRRGRRWRERSLARGPRMGDDDDDDDERLTLARARASRVAGIGIEGGW